MDQPAAPASAGHTKQYVFVDEYNRHKRLKVMRACDGCRKRKIRCDGAVQNGPWPCGACLRLKLKCVPPTLDPDEDQQTPESTSSSTQYSFQNSTVGSVASSATSNGASPYAKMVHEWSGGSNLPTPTSSIQADLSTNVYGSQFFSQTPTTRVPHAAYSGGEYFGTTSQHQPDSAGVPSLTRTETLVSEGSGGDPEEVDAAVKELSQQMGELTVDHLSQAPWIRDQHKKSTEVPAQDDANVLLPQSVYTDSTVRIPPEMMPTEERALDYFGYFFDYVHPYVPVLNRGIFYDQWHRNRSAISPLILEGIFACVSQYLEDPIEVRRWLALAAKHEESFKDTPRLSTIQALLILTKAREFLPRPGYYYRSWMAVKYMTSMAVDLSLNEHLDRHRGGNGCQYNRAECLLRTRIWQTLFAVEILIGAPQGRTNFAVELESVDVSMPNPSHEIDNAEYQLARRTTYFTQAVRNIKQTNNLWQTIRRLKKDWALDPMFMRQNEVIPAWLKTLPVDMQITYPDDETPPFLAGDHYVAYLHMYHHLIIVMHHRPQLQTLLEKRDSAFKTHLDICNDSATKICRLQEALLRDFGVHGMQFMQRGTNFSIYCILTCAMLHLATITSPDPAVNGRARHYFTRHMRVLERCIPSAAPEVKVQIDALRQAFSNDTSKAFELKPDLGLRSPSVESKPTPPGVYSQALPSQGGPAWAQMQDPLSSKAISPSGEYGQQFQQASAQAMPYTTTAFPMPSQPAYNQHAALPQISTAPTGYPLEPVISNEHQQHTPVWDPSGIFSQWNNAFGPPAQTQQTPPAAAPQQDPRMQLAAAMPPPQPQQSPQHVYSQQMPAAAAAAPSASMMPTVTPVMWQNAFTDAYVSGHGHKRFRDDGAEGYGGYQKRRGTKEDAPLPPLPSGALFAAITTTSSEPQDDLGIWSMIVSHLIEAVIVLALRVLLAWENKRRDKLQAQMEGGLEARDLDATAFSDMTDRENLNFRYTY